MDHVVEGGEIHRGSHDRQILRGKLEPKKRKRKRKKEKVSVEWKEKESMVGTGQTE